MREPRLRGSSPAGRRPGGSRRDASSGSDNSEAPQESPHSNLEIDLAHRQCRIGGTVLDEGDFLSLDGNGGAVYAGKLEALVERPERALAAIGGWRRIAA